MYVPTLLAVSEYAYLPFLVVVLTVLTAFHFLPDLTCRLFRRSDVAFSSDEDAVARAFADIATLLVLDVGDIDASRLADRLGDALDSRIVVEQAKGVLAEQHQIDMAEAYERLVRDAIGHGRPLTSWAADVVAEAQRPRA